MATTPAEESAVPSFPTPPRRLSFEERVAARRAIEQVYWRHRIWPEQNPGTKPSFDSVLPDAVLRERVADELRRSNALEAYWSRPLTTEQLQREMYRMVRSSRDGAMLDEIFGALNNDPLLIAECLARPALTDRLIHTWYARDERFHGELKRRVEESGGASPDTIEETTWLASDCVEPGGIVRSVDGAGRGGGLSGEGEGPGRAMPSSASQGTDAFGQQRGLESNLEVCGPDLWPPLHRGEQTAASLSGSATTPPATPSRTIRVARAEWPAVADTARREARSGGLREDDESFYLTSIVSDATESITLRTARWEKTPFDAWWRQVRDGIPAELPEVSGPFTAAAVTAASCTDDTWQSTAWSHPHPRNQHEAVWTGSEMIVWGGYPGAGSPPYETFTGGRYDPATDTWTSMRVDATTPTARVAHTMIWTGAEVVIWGGGGDITSTNTGARYDPQANTWAVMSPAMTPYPGTGGAAVIWTGTEMIIWGGGGPGVGGVGARYNPVSDSWLPVSPGPNAPVGYIYASGVWTNGKMIVWGGLDNTANPTNTGSAYNPTTDTWLPLTTVGAPSPRKQHSAVWTNGEMIVWGGADVNDNPLDTGARYKPATNSWTPLPSTAPGVPDPRANHHAFWTGSEMIIWGGTSGTTAGVATGSRYRPSTDTWTVMSTINSQGYGEAVWTGSELLIWGGTYNGIFSVLSDTGARYDLATDTWVPMGPGASLPGAGGSVRAVWTGAEVIVGGSGTRRYDPATDTWTAVSTTGIPSARVAHVALWTGSEMIVWGGSPNTNTGGRYDPATNTWTPTSVGASVPEPRYYVEGVWTGKELIVWGGFSSATGQQVNTGGRYDPVADTWAPTSLSANVPSPRSLFDSVWTGSEMIVWGGEFGSPVSYLNTGGRYDPATDTWQPTSIQAATPSSRSSHTMVWTGSEMIVWGGRSGGATGFGDGSSYDPATDQWSPVASGGPSSRYFHEAAWTDSEMIVWGGRGIYSTDSGSRYDPVQQVWRSTGGGPDLPAGRQQFASSWTGGRLFVWGGYGYYPAGQWGGIGTGGLYCAGPCSSPSGIPELSVSTSASGALLTWSPVPAAARFDVVGGGLMNLRGTGGDFATVTSRCLAHDTGAYATADFVTPAAGDGTWYLLRPKACIAGTYDSAGPSQIAPRDGSIAASPAACP